MGHVDQMRACSGGRWKGTVSCGFTGMGIAEGSQRIDRAEGGPSARWIGGWQDGDCDKETRTGISRGNINGTSSSTLFFEGNIHRDIKGSDSTYYGFNWRLLCRLILMASNSPHCRRVIPSRQVNFMKPFLPPSGPPPLHFYKLRSFKRNDWHFRNCQDQLLSNIYRCRNKLQKILLFSLKYHTITIHIRNPFEESNKIFVVRMGKMKTTLRKK